MFFYKKVRVQITENMDIVPTFCLLDRG